MKPPFFVMGAPRSGTTYLVEVLNRHERVLMTNELRLMTFLNRVLNRLPQDKWILMNGRKSFLEHLKQEVPVMVERYYESLGASEDTRWGDKHPHYADPRTDPECLDLINDLFPESQFINLVRDGREVVASLMAKGWADLGEAMDVWSRHVKHADDFGRHLASDRFLTVRYEMLVNRPYETIDEVLRFLRIPASDRVTEFLRAQARQRTPFSEPTSGRIGVPTADRHLSDSQRQRVFEDLGPLLAALGYME
jgi:hypothetical protein